MALDFANNTGNGRTDIIPRLQYDARFGELTAVNREPQPDGTWQQTEVSVEMPMRCVVDLENIEQGWVIFNPAPQLTVAPVSQPKPERPSPAHKDCARIKLFSKEHGLREFMSAARSVMTQMDRLHNESLADARSHPGKMPVVEMTGTETVKVKTPEGEAKFKVPAWSIVGWTLPPDAFAGKQPEAAPPAPPASKPAPKPARADDADEF